MALSHDERGAEAPATSSPTDSLGAGAVAVSKARKPYTIGKQRERWTEAEHASFVEALQKHGRAWRRIEEHVGSKTAVQIRSHAQKFFSKVDREKARDISGGSSPITIPPPRPKRKSSQMPTKALGETVPQSFVLHQVLRDQVQQLLGENASCSLIATIAASAATAATTAATAVMTAAQHIHGLQVRAPGQQDDSPKCSGKGVASPKGSSAHLLPAAASPDAGARPSDDWTVVAQTAATASSQWEIVRLNGLLLPRQPAGGTSGAPAAVQALLQPVTAVAEVQPLNLSAPCVGPSSDLADHSLYNSSVLASQSVTSQDDSERESDLSDPEADATTRTTFHADPHAGAPASACAHVPPAPPRGAPLAIRRSSFADAAMQPPSPRQPPRAGSGLSSAGLEPGCKLGSGSAASTTLRHVSLAGSQGSDVLPAPAAAPSAASEVALGAPPPLNSTSSLRQGSCAASTSLPPLAQLLSTSTAASDGLFSRGKGDAAVGPGETGPKETACCEGDMTQGTARGQTLARQVQSPVRAALPSEDPKDSACTIPTKRPRLIEPAEKRLASLIRADCMAPHGTSGWLMRAAEKAAGARTTVAPRADGTFTMHPGTSPLQPIAVKATLGSAALPVARQGALMVPPMSKSQGFQPYALVQAQAGPGSPFKCA